MPGLRSEEAARRRRRDGPNAIPAERRPSAFLLLLRQLTHFFAILLWAAAGLAAIGGMPELALAIVIVIAINGAFAFVQEYRADRSSARLAKMMPSWATAVRDGQRVSVHVEDLVVGDLVLLSAGDRIPADLALTEGHALAVDESLLTGESATVHPFGDATLHAGTYVVEGEAEAVVVATGARTRLGRIASLSRRARRPTSPLARRLHRVVRFVAVAAAAIGATFFGVSLALHMAPTEGFLLAVGVTVALVPEGLLPTVTLSLARAAQRMARESALVRHLESVETLGSATFICTDKTGTLTRNQMSVVEVWTPAGLVSIAGEGYEPYGVVEGEDAALAATRALAETAARSSGGGVRLVDGEHRPVGDPMEAALHVLAARVGADPARLHAPVTRRFPFDPRRRRSSVIAGGFLHVKGAPDAVLPRCHPCEGAAAALSDMTARGLRVLAVARRTAPEGRPSAAEAERELVLLGLVALEDPPREGVREALARCREAKIRVAMVTGDHPDTAAAIGREIGLVGRHPLVVEGTALPTDEASLGALLDRDEVIVARVSPEDKLRITRALQRRGHVVAMTGDGVNDGPALRRADIGIAMGASGTDVAREAADLVLLDDHFATIVKAVELGRAVFANVRRFLTYHLVDNVAEVVPFVVWAISGGAFPLALGVLQILALDIGTDILPALALGAEPPSARTMRTGPPERPLIDRRVVFRVFGVLGPVEAAVSLFAFALVLQRGGYRWGFPPEEAVLASASGAAFATVVLGQMATAIACRSETRAVGALGGGRNPLLLAAIATEIVALGVFLSVPPFPAHLGGTVPPLVGWIAALSVVPCVLLADLAYKATLRWRPTALRGSRAAGQSPRTSR